MYYTAVRRCSAGPSDMKDMSKIEGKMIFKKNAKYLVIVAAVSVLLFGYTGCSKSEPPPAPAAGLPAERGPAAASSTPPAQSAVADSEFKPAAADAPVVAEKYSELASMALVYAKLTDDLPAGVLLQTPTLAISARDLDGEIAKAPPQMQEELRRNAFFVLDQTATQKILAEEACQTLSAGKADESRLLQQYCNRLIANAAIVVEDEEVEAFYKENTEMMGGAGLDAMKDAIRQHLLQQKQQEFIEEHIRAAGRRVPIKLSAAWTAEQARAARDNVVERARTNGLPSFVNFGAKGCVPCDMMEPIREELRKEYEGRLNVVFVHVREQQILAARYGVRGIPHLVFFDRTGKKFHTHTGFMPKEQILAAFRKVGELDDTAEGGSARE